MATQGETAPPDKLGPDRDINPSFRNAILFLIVGVIVAALIGFGALQLRAGEGPLVGTETPTPLNVSVETAQMQSSYALDDIFSGLATAGRESTLGFSGAGRIEEIRVDIGERVQAGQTLAILDTRALAAQLISAQAQIAQAVSGRDLAATTLTRQQELQRRGHVSQQIVDEVASQVLQAQAQIDAATAGADALQVQISLATLTAPFNGVITKRFTDEGGIASPATPILTLVESGPLEAVIGITPAHAAGLEIGQIVNLEGATGPVSARFKASSGVVDLRSRTIDCIFEIDADQNVVTGEVLRLNLSQSVDSNGFWVPITALIEAQRGLWSVYVVEPQSGDAPAIVTPRAVEIIYTDGARAYVRGMVEDDEQFVIEGISRIVPGQTVRAVTKPE